MVVNTHHIYLYVNFVVYISQIYSITMILGMQPDFDAVSQSLLSCVFVARSDGGAGSADV